MDNNPNSVPAAFTQGEFNPLEPGSFLPALDPSAPLTFNMDYMDTPKAQYADMAADQLQGPMIPMETLVQDYVGGDSPSATDQQQPLYTPGQEYSQSPVSVQQNYEGAGGGQAGGGGYDDGYGQPMQAQPPMVPHYDQQQQQQQQRQRPQQQQQQSYGRSSQRQQQQQQQPKREGGSASSVNNDHTSEQGSDHTNTESGNVDVKTQRMRAASKKYRQRKKEAQHRTEQRLQELERRNAELENEASKHKDLIDAISAENIRMRDMMTGESVAVGSRRDMWRSRLKQIVDNGFPDDADLEEAIRNVKANWFRSIALEILSTEPSMRKTVTQNLNDAQYFNPRCVAALRKGGKDLRAIAYKTMLRISDLNDVQRRKIAEEADYYHPRAEKLFEYRKSLCKEMSGLYVSNAADGAMAEDPSSATEMMELMKDIQSSFNREADEWERCILAMLDSLTPRQEAQVLLGMCPVSTASCLQNSLPETQKAVQYLQDGTA